MDLSHAADATIFRHCIDGIDTLKLPIWSHLLKKSFIFCAVLVVI